MALKNIDNDKLIKTTTTTPQQAGEKVLSKSLKNTPIEFPKTAENTEETKLKDFKYTEKNSDLAHTSKSSTIKESPLEKEINAYLLENNLTSTNIDDLRAMLLNKKNKTAKELELLNRIQAQFEASKSSLAKEDHKPLVSIDEMLDDKWTKKTPKEKVDTIADKYFEKTDENYKNLSSEEKAALKQKQLETFAKDLANKNDTKITSAAKASGMFEVLNDNKMTIADYNKLSKEEKVQLYRDHQIKTMKNLQNAIPKKLVESGEWSSMSADEQLLKIAEYTLEQNDPKFKEIKDPAKKAQYINAKADEIMTPFISNWKDADTEDKRQFIAAFGSIGKSLSVAKGGKGMSFDEYLSLDENAQSQILKQTQPNKTEADLIVESAYFQSALEKQKITTISEIRANIEANNDTDKNKKVQILKALDAKIKYQGKNASIKFDTIENEANSLGKSQEEIVNIALKQISNAESQEEKYRRAEILLQKANGQYSDIIIPQLKKMGINETFIKNTMKKNEVHYEKMYHDFLTDDGKEVAKTINLADYIGDKKAAKSIAEDTPKNLSIKESQNTGVILTNEKSEYLNNFTTGVNKYIENPVQYSSQMVQREDLSDSGRALFTQSVVETAPTPERQKAYAKELSSLGYESVNEGLAAASNNVDKSVRNEYNSYIKEAIKDYPPEKQATIQKAMKTGEVSQETLAKTTPEAPKTQAQQQNNTQSTNKTETSNINKTTSNQKANKVQEATVSNTSVGAKPQAKSTQTIVSQESKELQAKKNNLINKIISYETEKAEKTIEREKTKNEKVQSVSSEKNNETDSVKEKNTSAKTIENAKSTSQANNLELSEDEQTTLKEIIIDLFTQNSASAAYSKINDDIKEKFMQAFANQGKESDVISFANDYKGNPDTIVKLINYSYNDGLKLELTRLLPSSRINDIISSGKLSSNDISKLAKEGKVDNKILMNYLKKNKNSMTYEQIKEYMKYMPLDYRSEIYDLLKTIPGSQEWEEANNQNMKAAIAQTPTTNDIANLDDGIAIGSNKIPMRGQYDKMKRKGPFYLNA